jgi:hypothetical protein
MSYIYLYSDSGYTDAVKIGYDSSEKCRQSWKSVPSYAPRPMLFHAAWKVADRFYSGGKTRKEALEIVEKSAHRLSGPLVHKQPGYERAGRDWVLCTVDQAIQLLSDFFASGPALTAAVQGKVTNCDFRNPHPRNLESHPTKVVLWVYRERHTRRLKVQFVDNWSSPFEVNRRYSRNGIEELAAFTYAGIATGVGNMRVYATWSEVVTALGYGTDDTYYGWLRPEAELAIVRAMIGLRLEAVPVDRSNIPEGVRPSYNRTWVKQQAG